MHRLPPSVATAIAATILLTSAGALAEGPTVSECLAATNASLKTANEHKLRAERAQLLVCAAASCPAAIRKDCMSRVDTVNAQIPTIIFGAKDGSGADLSVVKVTMDGEVLAQRLDGIALALDPGDHTFTFETPGQPLVAKRLTIQQSQTERHEVITFGTPLPAALPVQPPPEAAPAPLPVVAAPPPSSQPPPASPVSKGLGTQRILAITAAGIGVVGLGLGAAFGAIAISDKSSAQNACPGSACPTQSGSNQWSSAASAGNVSTIGFIIGGVGVAGAAVLWFAAPKATIGTSMQAGFGPGAFQVRGTW